MGSTAYLWKICHSSSRCWPTSAYIVIPSRFLCTTLPKLASEKTEAEVVSVHDILEDLKKPELSEEEIMSKRLKSRLPERIYKRHVLKEPVPLESKYEYKTNRLKNYYARFGKDSKLNPGICWPTREEVLETIKYDKMFEPPLEERIKNVETKRLAEEQQKKRVEDEVDKNMANLDKWTSDYYGRIEKRNAKALELKQQRERLVEEISEYLGYDIDPKDPRFKEAVEQREKEKKKAMKAKRQQESYDKMLEKLKKIAQSAK